MATVPVPNFEIKRGDTAPQLTATLKDRAGAAVDLTDATAVLFVMRRVAALTNSEPAISGAMTFQPDGTVTYLWAPGDTDHAGMYLAEFVVTWTSGREQTYPTNSYVTITVYDDLEGHLASLRAVEQAAAPVIGSRGLVATNDATAKALLALKCSATTAPQLSDTDLDQLVLIAKRPSGVYAINRAAVEGWRWKAARAAGGFSFSADGTAVDKTMLMEHCLAMAKAFARGQVRTVQVDTQLSPFEVDYSDPANYR